MMYAIHAYEARYGGLHGIESFSIDNLNSEKEAIESAVDQSMRVITGYTLDEIILEADELVYAGELDKADYDEWIDDTMREETAYEIYKVVKTDGLSEQELENEFYNDWETFVEERCEDC